MMHTSLVLLTLVSTLLIALMISCFICFVRSRRKEDEELIRYATAAATRHAVHQTSNETTTAMGSSLTPLHRQGGDRRGSTDPSQKAQNNKQQHSQSPSNENVTPAAAAATTTTAAAAASRTTNNYAPPPYQSQTQSQQQNTSFNYTDQQDQFTAAAMAAVASASPYHQTISSVPGFPETTTRSDMTQQINSAIIGSTEAEFQNDFIQVFPMYQIAPLPEKNTTPYLT